MKEQHRQLTIGDSQVHVWERGRGRPLLLVHGFPLDHTMWVGQLEELADEFRIVAPDLPGFGQNAAVSGTATMDRTADFLAQLLDRLEIAQPVSLCGLSMGGYVAFEFWQRYRSRLERLVLCDTRAAADTPEVARGRELMAASVEQDGSASVAAALLPKLFGPAPLADSPPCVIATQAVIEATAPSSIAAYQRGMAQREDFTPKLAEIEVPTLLVCGVDDVITPAAEMRSVAQSMPAAKYVEIPGAGHMAPLEQPAAVNQALRQFLTAANGG